MMDYHDIQERLQQSARQIIHRAEQAVARAREMLATQEELASLLPQTEEWQALPKQQKVEALAEMKSRVTHAKKNLQFAEHACKRLKARARIEQ